MPLPDFIIIGAMKSGTSTLHSNLQLHPEIGMSDLKETHFFNKEFHKNLDWYSAQFSSGKRLNGESTPAYTWNHIYPKVPSRIFKTIPNAKLIYVVRDPIDRIISHLHHDLYRDRFKLKDIDKVVLKDPQYLKTSSYFFQISKYLKFFENENILIVQTSDLKYNLNRTLNEICEFLETHNFDFSEKSRVRNQSSRKYLIKNYDKVHKIVPRRFTKLYHWLFYFINIKIERPALKPDTLREIKKVLKKDVEKLQEIKSLKVDSWKTYNNINL